MTYAEFINVVACFAAGKSVTGAAQHSNLAENTVRRFYNMIHEQITGEVSTSAKIGDPGKIVEVDEAKFGKRKFNRGRMVEGTLILGGIERGSNKCFLAPCPGNRRDETTLVTSSNSTCSPGLR